jgi:pantothenate synthetase
MTRDEELSRLRDSPRPAARTILEKAVARVLDEAQGLLEMANREQKTDEGPVLATWLGTLLSASAPDAQIEFIAVVDPESLQFLELIETRALVAVGIKTGTERALDSVLIQRLR